MFDDAYFEVSYVRAYSTALPQPSNVLAPTSAAAAPTTISQPDPPGSAEVSNTLQDNPSPTRLAGSSGNTSGASMITIPAALLGFSAAVCTTVMLLTI